MSEPTLKTKATKGMLWNALERFSVQFGQLVIGIILARILMPEDFGLIGMLTIFIAISQIFVSSGMGSGLIQKKNRTEVDYSTVFVFNLSVSVVFYIVLFVSAPLIAKFYNTPQLVLLTRVLTLNVVINSLAVVQRSRLSINLDFKTIAKVNVISIFTSGAISIAFAYLGFGVWALVIQNLSRAIFSVILFWFLSRWQPSIIFSKQSFKELFGYGSKLLLSGIYAQTVNNIYNMVIGKYFSSAELGFYTRAKTLAELAAGTVAGVLHQVTFPILSSLQDDSERLKMIFGRMIRMAAFLIFPTMTILAFVADPFIRLILTEKWAPAIPLFQWMCFARILYPVGVINLNVLNAVGRSDLYLKVEVAKFPFFIAILLITLPYGIKAMVIGHVVLAAIAFFMNAYLPGKFYKYGPFEQLRDMVPVIIATLISAGFMFLSLLVINSLWLKLFVPIIVGGFVFLGSSYVLKIRELEEVKLLIRNLVKKNGE